MFKKKFINQPYLLEGEYPGTKNDALHPAKNFDLLIFTSQFCPKSNLIKDKIPVLGLDIVERQV